MSQGSVKSWKEDTQEGFAVSINKTEQEPRGMDQLEAAQAQGVRFVLFDIDDTITKGGLLLEESYSALWRLGEAGLKAIPVTGRPAGWCDLIARQWPVDAVVGENGAFVFRSATISTPRIIPMPRTSPTMGISFSAGIFSSNRAPIAAAFSKRE